jgi:small subunit ribosomal protein S5
MAYEEEKDEFEEKVLYINRSAKVVKGGRKFSFSALILVGNGQGKVGYGFAKANEVSDAIKKASESARKNVFEFELAGNTIPHEVSTAQDGVKLLMKPASSGTGIVAGSKVRSVLELAGVRDVIAKNLGGNNPFNQVRATIKALKMLMNRELTLKERGV